MVSKKRKVGDVVVAVNGYSYTYIAGDDGKPERMMTSWLVGKKKYGRYPDTKVERVRFIDGDKANLTPENIEYVPMNGDRRKYLRNHIATLKDRIREMESELLDCEAELTQLERVRS